MGRAVTSTLHRAHTSASIYIYTKSIDRLPAGATCRYSHRPRIATQRQIGKTVGSPIDVPDQGSERFQSRVCWNPGKFVTRTFITVSKFFEVSCLTFRERILHILSLTCQTIMYLKSYVLIQRFTPHIMQALDLKNEEKFQTNSFHFGVFKICLNLSKFRNFLNFVTILIFCTNKQSCKIFENPIFESKRLLSGYLENPHFDSNISGFFQGLHQLSYISFCSYDTWNSQLLLSVSLFKHREQDL